MKKKNTKVILKIKELVEFATTDKSSSNMVVEIEEIKKYEAEKIKIKIGKDLSGYKRIIDKSSINHTLKQHGNDEKESLRGNVAVVKKDFEKIPVIVQTENIIYSGKDRIGNDIILYEKQLGSIYFYAEEIRKGKKQLCLKTLYKRKPKK